MPRSDTVTAMMIRVRPHGPELEVPGAADSGGRRELEGLGQKDFKSDRDAGRDGPGDKSPALRLTATIRLSHPSRPTESIACPGLAASNSGGGFNRVCRQVAHSSGVGGAAWQSARIAGSRLGWESSGGALSM